MRVEVGFFLASRRDNKLWVQQAAISGGSTARCSDWHDHLVGDGADYLNELVVETKMNGGTSGMHHRSVQLSVDVEAWEQLVNPGDCVDDLDFVEPLFSHGVDVSSYIIQKAVRT